MKILLVTRGSNGDVLPYLAITEELYKRGHDVTICIPKIFEKEAQQYQFKYVLQDFEDISNMIENASKSISLKVFLKWITNVIDTQFQQFVPMVEQCDVFISTNTEFAAASIAEYCKKPFIRTAFAPFIIGKKIPPPLSPFTKENNILVPLIWSALNSSTNMLVRKILNKNRLNFGMNPIKKCTEHSVEFAHNTLLYSSFLGNVDKDWKYKWNITGYCFNDSFKYDENSYNDFISFVKKDSNPTIFFTFGSCTSKKAEQLVQYLFDICSENNYKLVIGAGWAHTGTHLNKNENLLILDKAIPHNLIFPECDAIIHHGGAGTSHNVARMGKPQLIIPLFLDQHYFANRILKLGLGPKHVTVNSITKEKLRAKINDLITNPLYKKNCQDIGKLISAENGIKNFCDFIENKQYS